MLSSNISPTLPLLLDNFMPKPITIITWTLSSLFLSVLVVAVILVHLYHLCMSCITSDKNPADIAV
jgi:hypothetical protein